MAKRKQVKNACINCQKACKKCDDSRPCERCVKYGIEGTCVNSARKERKRGVKRGPYNRKRADEYGETDSEGSPASGDDADEGSSSVSSRAATPLLSSSNLRIRITHGTDDLWRTNTIPGKLTRPWNTLVDPTRPIRAVRNKVVSYSEEFGLGFPDSSHLAALAQVCSELFEEIYHISLPKAVSYPNWPPFDDDHHFESVQFSDFVEQNRFILTPTPVDMPTPPETPDNRC